MDAADERGRRNIANDGDKIYVIDVSNSSNYGNSMDGLISLDMHNQ
jgi:hypothetical protein